MKRKKNKGENEERIEEMREEKADRELEEKVRARAIG